MKVRVKMSNIASAMRGGELGLKAIKVEAEPVESVPKENRGEAITNLMIKCKESDHVLWDTCAYAIDGARLKADPIEERPEWEIKFDEKIVVDTYGAKDFIRTEIIDKIFTEIVYHCCPDRGTEAEINRIKSEWLGGKV